MFSSFFGNLTGSSNTAGDGFLGSVVGSVQSGVEKVATEVLPNWVATQLDVQQSPTAQPTYYRTPDMQSLSGATLDQAKMDIKTQTEIDTMTLVALGALAIGGLFLIIKA